MNITVERAESYHERWAKEMLKAGHYLHTVPDPRTRPLCLIVQATPVGKLPILSGRCVGCLWFGRPEATKCFQGGLTYGSLDDVAGGRAAFDRWEVLNLSRVWFDPIVQPGGAWHGPRFLPGFIDRKGQWRSALASTAIVAALGMIGYEYLLKHPPCFVEQPYAIRAVLSYCDTRLHKGTIYRAAGFQLARRNRAGIETYWTPAVSPLKAGEDRDVRNLAARHPRSVRIRESAAAIAGLGGKRSTVPKT